MNNQLEEYRKEIDALDIELIDVLARRIDVVRKVGVLKAQSNISVVQQERAEAVKNRAAEMGAAKGLDESFIRKVYDMMIDHAHDLEHDIMDAKS
ncbi:MAG: chorismate mutase [Alphaproteobacteria bacterium]|nr:chorismate mutase [Alphaproteobacteria bacterium]